MSLLSQIIAHRLIENRDTPLLLWNDLTWTGGEIDHQARCVAAWLAAQGVRPGDRIAAGLPNSPELIKVIVGVLYSGAILVPLNPTSPAEEASSIIDNCSPRLVITHGDQARSLREAAVSAAVFEAADIADQQSTTGSQQLPSTETRPDETALIIYTSGTTGHPKGAMLSHRALVSNLLTVADAWHWTAADRLLLTLPCFHLHGLGLGVLASFMVGSSIVMRPRFDADEVLPLIEQHRCTMFFGVPTMYNRLVLLSGRAAFAPSLRSMRIWVTGSAPMTTSTYERFRESFGYSLMDRYGMTEACFVLSTPYDEPRRPGVVGRPLPGIEVRLVDSDAADTGRLTDVQPGEVGELVFRGPNLFSGYWNDRPATEAAFLNGFLRSGDLAVREADGMFRIVGRRSIDLIKSRGFKIHAVEIENCLQGYPAVAEVAVVGIPDSDRGETVVAVVTPRAGAAIDPEALRAHVREHLAPHKVPARVEIVGEIPRSGPGKFKKREIIERLRR